MRVAPHSAMIAQIRGHVLSQRGKSGDARRLIVKDVVSFAAQRAAPHAIPRQQRKESHIRLTRTKRPRRREMRFRCRNRRALQHLFLDDHGALCVARHHDRAADVDSGPGRRLQIAFTDQALVGVDGRVARHFQLNGEIACRRKRIAGLQRAVVDPLANLSRELVLQRRAGGAVDPDTRERAHINPVDRCSPAGQRRQAGCRRGGRRRRGRLCAARPARA